ncbi:MAG: nuclease domain-containing protein [Lewinella sp.]|uniref:nuclease domain-containing protein n=1 Tax=Lewinella sp. TaxID=2004506 RepID=UPI003D6BD6DC
MAYISEKLRKSANGKDCTLNIAGVCNYDRRTVVLAHINTDFGKMGGKSDDYSACFACSSCHTHLDTNKLDSNDELFYTRRALVRTWRIWFNEGYIHE